MKEGECVSSPCQNGGSCHNHVGGGFRCSCLPGFTGDICNVTGHIDTCSGMTCLHGGRCVNEGNQTMCVCREGYHGRRCEVRADRCQSSPCLNGATCIDNGKLVFCKCQIGFIGRYCEKGEINLIKFTDFNQCISRIINV